MGEKASLFPSSFRAKTKLPLSASSLAFFRFFRALRVVSRPADGAVSQGNSRLALFQGKKRYRSCFYIRKNTVLCFFCLPRTTKWGGSQFPSPGCPLRGDPD